MERRKQILARVLQVLFFLAVIFGFTYVPLRNYYSEIGHLLESAADKLLSSAIGSFGSAIIGAICLGGLGSFLFRIWQHRPRTNSLSFVARRIRLERRYQNDKLLLELELWRPAFQAAGQLLSSPLGLACWGIVLTWVVDFWPSQSPLSTDMLDGYAPFAMTLWQVHAGLFAISATVILFMLQLSSVRLKVNLTRVLLQRWDLRLTGLMGLGGILTIGGMNLLNAVGYRISGWTFLLNAIIFAIGVVCIAVLYLNTFRGLSEWAVQSERLHWISNVIESTLENEFESRISFAHLESLCKDLNIGLVISSDIPGFESIPAPYEGVLSDVRLDQLRTLSSSLLGPGKQSFSGTYKALIRWFPGRRVTAGEPLAFITTDDSRPVVAQSVAALFTILPHSRVATPNDLRQGLAQWKDDAFGAIDSRSPGTFDFILGGYLHIVEVLIQGLRDHNAVHKTGTTNSVFDWKPLSSIFDDLRSVLGAAVHSEEQPLIQSVMAFPRRLMQLSVDYGDHKVFVEACRLYQFLYLRSFGLAEDDNIHLVRTAWERLFEFSRFSLEIKFDRNPTDTELHRDMGNYITELLQVANTINMAALKKGDVQTVVKICRYLCTLLEDHRPENHGPHEWEVRRSPNDTALQKRYTAKQQLVQIKQELMCLVDQLLLGTGVVTTALYLRGGFNQADWQCVSTVVVLRWPDLGKLSTTLERAMASAIYDKLHWDSVLEEDEPLLGRFTTAFTSTEPILVLFYCIAGMHLASRGDHTAPKLGPNLSHLSGNLKIHQKALLAHDWEPLIPNGQTLTLLTQFIQVHDVARAAAVRQEQEAVAQAPLSPDRIRAFESAAVERWSQHDAFLYELARQYGHMTVTEGEVGSTPSVLMRGNAPKAVFLEGQDEDPILLSEFGAQYGSVLGLNEQGYLVRELLKSLPSVECDPPDPIIKRITQAFAELQPDRPAVLLVPATLVYEDDIAHSDRWRHTGTDGCPEITMDNFLGVFDNVPVFMVPNLETDAVILCPSALEITITKSPGSSPMFRVGEPRMQGITDDVNRREALQQVEITGASSVALAMRGTGRRIPLLKTSV